MKRRVFFKNLAGVVGLSVLMPAKLISFGQSAFAEEKRRGAAPAAGGVAGDLSLPMVEPGKGLAVGLNYVAKKTEIKDSKMKMERQGIPFESQKCSGCALYVKVGTKDGKEVGKCAVFQGQLVDSEFWCNSWAKKS